MAEGEPEAPPGWKAVYEKLASLGREPDLAFSGQWIGAGPDGDLIGPEPSIESLAVVLAGRGVADADMVLAFVHAETELDDAPPGGVRIGRPLNPFGGGELRYAGLRVPVVR